VPRPVSPYYFTIRAEENCVELFHHLHKCYFNRLLQEARVSAESNSVEYSSDGYERNMCVNEVFSADVDREQQKAEISLYRKDEAPHHNDGLVALADTC
jgi:hypothetical protein